MQDFKEVLDSLLEQRIFINEYKDFLYERIYKYMKDGNKEQEDNYRMKLREYLKLEIKNDCEIQLLRYELRDDNNEKWK